MCSVIHIVYIYFHPCYIDISIIIGAKIVIFVEVTKTFWKNLEIVFSHPLFNNRFLVNDSRLRADDSRLLAKFSRLRANDSSVLA